jgi:hypothetical protein
MLLCYCIFPNNFDIWFSLVTYRGTNSSQKDQFHFHLRDLLEDDLGNNLHPIEHRVSNFRVFNEFPLKY